MKFDVIFYDLPNGVKPAEEFILSLDKKNASQSSSRDNTARC